MAARAASEEAADRIVVLFGNRAPQMQVLQEDGSQISVPAEHLNQSVTRVELEPEIDDPKRVAHTLSTDNDLVLSLIARALPASAKRYAVVVQHLEHTLEVHSAGLRPTWVASDDSVVQRVLAEWFGCAEGEPVGLLTNAGRDALHSQHTTTGAQPAAFNFVAVTASTATPLVGDTTLPGEITTAGGGLLRAQGTVAHTSGTNTTTITKTLTANGSDALPVVLAQIGVLNASSAGTLGYHSALNSTATLNVSGDNTTITETLTIG